MYYFIVNPNAKSGKGRIIWQKVRHVMNSKGLAYEALFTEKKGQAAELARKAAKQIICEMVVKYGATIMVKPNVIINENIAFLMRVTVSSHFGSQFTVTSDHSFGYVLNKQAS